jgi:hypothetical protein
MVVLAHVDGDGNWRHELGMCDVILEERLVPPSSSSRGRPS